jgi:hypothetical protein
MVLEQLIGKGKWEKALLAYQTPASFADDTYVDLVYHPKNGSKIPIRLFTATGNPKRRTLMAQLKEDRLKNPDQKQRWKNDGDACFLCDNVGQAQEVGNNLLLPIDAYATGMLMPNRYPLLRGHLLFVEKQHDKEGPKIGNTLTEHYLFEIVDLSQKYDLIALRNHAQAGMSIGNHDHFHLLPGIVPTRTHGLVFHSGLFASSLENTRYGKNIQKVTNADFDVLAISGNYAPEKLMHILKRFEEEGKIFTIAQYKGTFFIVPHLKQQEKIGSGDPNYIATIEPGARFDYATHMNTIKGAFHAPGTFNWAAYI